MPVVTPVRDFIYLDADRLYSLYSQVYEGVAEQIVQSYITELTTSDSQRSSPLAGSSAATQAAEVSGRTENRLLYDHMYNQLESRLSPLVISPTQVGADTFRDILPQAFMVKVQGLAEIEDFERLVAILDKYNAMGEAIAYATLQSPGINSEGSSRGAPQPSGRKHQDQKHRDLKAVAAALGLRQDETMLKNLKRFAELFNSTGFEITVLPTGGDDRVAYRGVLDRRWLRLEPALIRSLYGMAPVPQWTLVGQITHIPGSTTATTRQLTAPEEQSPQTNPDSPSLRDSFRGMFRASAIFEKMFLESDRRIEIVIAPLALYREFTPSQAD
jgi:hypothetical protein